MSIEKQLQRYKKRDLESSFHDRVMSKCSLFGPPKVIHRRHFPEGSYGSRESFSTKSCTSFDAHLSLPALPMRPAAQKHKYARLLAEDSKLSVHEWIEKRKKLRSDLKKFEFKASWLKRKPQRSGLEERVLALMRTAGGEPLSLSFLKDKQGSFPTADSTNDTSAPVSLETVSAALDKIASGINENKLLLNFFNTFGSEKISQDQCENGLTKVQDFINLSQIDKDAILEYYFKENEKSALFYSDLLEAVRYSEESIPLSLPLLEQRQQNSRAKKWEFPKKRLFDEGFSLPSLQQGKTPREMRFARLQESDAIFKALQTQQVPLEKATIEKGLLHPGDLGGNSSLPSFKVRLPVNQWSQKAWQIKLEKRRILLENAMEKANSSPMSKTAIARLDVKKLLKDGRESDLSEEDNFTCQSSALFDQVSAASNLESASSIKNVFEEKSGVLDGICSHVVGDGVVVKEGVSFSGETTSIQKMESLLSQVKLLDLQSAIEVVKHDIEENGGKLPSDETAMQILNEVIEKDTAATVPGDETVTHEIPAEKASLSNKFPTIKLTHRQVQRSEQRKGKLQLKGQKQLTKTTKQNDSSSKTYAKFYKNGNSKNKELMRKLKLNASSNDKLDKESKIRHRITFERANSQNIHKPTTKKEKSVLKLPKLKAQHSKSLSSPRQASDPNAFWPGHGLDVMRLCMPGDVSDDNSKNVSRSKWSIFYPVRITPH